jgi:hypothetical protein
MFLTEIIIKGLGFHEVNDNQEKKFDSKNGVLGL